jgi:arylsulfatase A-like enzyme
VNETNRREFLRRLGLSTAALSATGTIAHAAKTEPKHPNVLFIFTDDQREDTIGALGNPHIHTPHLDELAHNGVVFTNAYCMGGFSAAVCAPSRMMTLRGRSWFSVRDLSKGFPNFPTSMNEGGYFTFHLGKRGNTDQEVQALFSENQYVRPGHTPDTSENDADNLVRREGIPGRQLADGAIAFLHRRNRSKPFFMYLAGPEPHDPRVAPKEYLNRYDVEKIPLPANYLPFHPFDNGEMFIRDERLAPWPRTEGEVRGHLRDYYATITCLDEQLGRIFDTLKDLDEYENTIIVFSSDQGIAIGSHGLMGKQNLYEHSMGVPLVFAGPGIPKERRSEAFAYLFDIFPTVCELAGLPVPPGLDGKSLAPIIRGERRSVRDTMFLAYKDVQRAVRRGRWKLIRYPQVDKTQLFDLETDPCETQGPRRRSWSR